MPACSVSDVEIDRAQHPHDREAHGLGDQPADDQDQDRKQQARQELADLRAENARIGSISTCMSSIAASASV